MICMVNLRRAHAQRARVCPGCRGFPLGPEEACAQLDASSPLAHEGALGVGQGLNPPLHGSATLTQRNLKAAEPLRRRARVGFLTRGLRVLPDPRPL